MINFACGAMTGNQVELYVGTYMANGTTLEELKRHREERLNRTVRLGA